ncbi:MAG: hypothetical protein HZB91_12640 [Elusimicrobia bacterium]|nr:hypothetical protein [Elusimicrobiota bacterium]
MTPGWRLICAVGLVYWACRQGAGRAFLPSERRCAFFFLSGLALRVALGLWGPYHHNGQGPDWVWIAIGPPGKDPLFYGPGYFEVMGWIAWLPIPPDLPLFAFNALLSAACPVLVLALVSGICGRGRRADLAACLLLCDPISVRYAASEAHFSSIIALVLSVSLLLVLAARLEDDGRGSSAVLLSMAAGLLASQATRIHPIAWIPTGLAPLSLAVMENRKRPGSALASSLKLAGIAAATGLGVSLARFVEVFQQIVKPRGDNPVPLPFRTFLFIGTSRWLAGALAVPVALLLWLRGKGRVAAVLAAAWIALVATRDTYDMSHMFTAGHDRLFFPALLAGLAALLPARLGAACFLAVPLWVGTVLTAYAPRILQKNTEQLEYGFLRRQLLGLPADCICISPGPAHHPVLRVPEYVRGGRGEHGGPKVIGVTSEQGFLDAVSGPGCRYYIRTSVCSFGEYADFCAWMDRHPRLAEAARRRFPARSSTDCWRYDGQEVEVVLYRVGEPRPPGRPTGRARP